MASPSFASTNSGSGQKAPSRASPDSMQDTSANGSAAPASAMTAVPSALPSTTGAPKTFPSLLAKHPKIGSLDFPSLLTGKRQAAAGNNSNNTATSSDGNKETTETSGNPTEALKTGYLASRPEDGPVNPSQPSSSFPQQSPINTQATETEKCEGRHPALGGLPSIATAASAMQIDTDTSLTTPARGGDTASDGGMTAGPVGSSPLTPEAAKYIADAMQAYILHTPLSAHPLSADAITPTTPGFPMSATTPTTPFSPHTPLTPGGGRSKHTCTHCNQTFTRHHNLKSHLLTHSHEKPFPCHQCNARFRRLHDLKRHSKLHTGERPHMCEKCGRRFARGDALARHARGEGGCAGRRNSLSGLLDGDTKMYGDGTDGDDEGMMDEDTQMENGSDTVTPTMEVGSTAPASDTAASTLTVTSTTSGARRPASLPSIKTNVADTHPNPHLHPHHQPQIHQIHQLQNYRPPMTPARSAASTGPSPGGSLFPPTPGHGKTPISATSNPNVLNSRRGASPMSSVTNNNAPSILGSGGMTESPRPLSPPQQADAVSGTKSPLGQFQPVGAKYAPPMTPQSAQPQNAPTSFAAGGPTSHTTNSRQPATSYPSQTPTNPTQPGQGIAPQAPMGFPPKSNPPTGGGNENPNLFENERGVWDYIKDLERRVAQLEGKQKGCDAFIAQAHQQSLAVAAVAAARAGAVAQAGTGSTNTQGGGAAAS
ncbi:hypothetical protein EV426DRAFT_413621 [Tirmania nivea]|nr:hypothetical protein EV426DRAFT_413621 [Tirmania nivea]